MSPPTGRDPRDQARVTALVRVTVTHRGWSDIRADHPARHGKDVGPFLAGLGMWWGDLLSALRDRA